MTISFEHARFVPRARESVYSSFFSVAAMNENMADIGNDRIVRHPPIPFF